MPPGITRAQVLTNPKMLDEALGNEYMRLVLFDENGAPFNLTGGQMGPPGPMGPAGPRGDTGPKGDKGDIGATGSPGAKGDTGAQGPQGVKGDTGNTGLTGPPGQVGDIGPQGPKGDKGDTGNTGGIGLQGPVGPQGPQGPQGLQGPTGASAPVIPVVTDLPSSPVDGQECYLYVGTPANSYWHMRFRGANQKWLYLGGPRLFEHIAVAESRGASGASVSYADIGTVGPKVSIPTPGEYDVDWGFGYGYHSTTAGAAFYMGLDGCGSTAAARHADSVIAAVDTPNVGVQPGRQTMRMTLTAGQLKALYYCSGPNGVGWYGKRYLSVTPFRLDAV